MRAKDVSLKDYILANNLDRDYNRACCMAFHGNNAAINTFKAVNGKEVSRVAKNVCLSAFRKYKTCYKKVGSIVEAGEAWFLTLTFTDEVLSKTSPETRRRYVARVLKGVSRCYVANVDFGKTTEREHYHAVVYSSEKPTLDVWTSCYGFAKVQKCADTENDLKRVCRYTAKLSRHALKRSTSRGIGEAPRLIYSRATMKLPPRFLFE